MTVNIQRYLYIDYFPPLVSWVNGLYIPNLEASENVDYNTFFAPFKANLWFTMISKLLFIYDLQCVEIHINYSIHTTYSILIDTYAHSSLTLTRCISRRKK